MLFSQRFGQGLRQVKELILELQHKIVSQQNGINFQRKVHNAVCIALTSLMQMP